MTTADRVVINVCNYFLSKRHYLTPVVLNLCPPCLCTQNKARHLRQKWKGTNNNKKVSYLSIRLVCFSLPQYAGLLAAPFFWPQAARAPNLGFRCLQTLKGSIGTVMEFLQARFSAGLTHSTLRVYVAAIAAYHAPLGGQSVGKDPLVAHFLHGLMRFRPQVRSSVSP